MRLPVTIFLLLFAYTPDGWLFQNPSPVLTIDTPQAGDVLQGVVSIRGSVYGETLSTYEVSFAYASSSGGTWFLIAEGDPPVLDGLLASWDTSHITDGDYRLRLRAVLTDGTAEEWILPDIRVRNYTPVESTAVQTEQGNSTLPASAEAVQLTTTSPLPTDTPLPVNPGSLTVKDFARALAGGAGVSALIFLLLGLYSSASRRSRRR